MSIAETPTPRFETRPLPGEVRADRWVVWPVSWSAVWVGALSALALALIIGLIGIAVGAHVLGPEHRVVDLRKFGFGALAFSVLGSFLAFALGGWVTAKVAGILRSEPAMLHGAVSWLVAVPLLVTLAAFGAGNYFGGWFGGLAGSPSWSSPGMPFERPLPPAPGATAEEVSQYRTDMMAYRHEVQQWKEDTPRATRNAALGAVTALLLGLIGSVVGGWMASGEPMNFSHHRTRPAVYVSP